MEHFRANPDSGVTHPGQIAVVGDRLFTDAMLANMMGAWGVWVQDGVVEESSVVRNRSSQSCTIELSFSRMSREESTC